MPTRAKPNARPRTRALAGAPTRWHNRTSWEGKLRPDLRPKVVPAPRTGEPMLVPTPLLVAEEIRKIRRGRLVTVGELRNRLARRFGAESTCPLTAGIMMHFVVGATEERLAAGKRPLAPWWRVLEDAGRPNVKWPVKAGRQAVRLEEEGHAVIRKQAPREWSVKIAAPRRAKQKRTM